MLCHARKCVSYFNAFSFYFEFLFSSCLFSTFSTVHSFKNQFIWHSNFPSYSVSTSPSTVILHVKESKCLGGKKQQEVSHKSFTMKCKFWCNEYTVDLKPTTFSMARKITFMKIKRYHACLNLSQTFRAPNKRALWGQPPVWADSWDTFCLV